MDESTKEKALHLVNEIRVMTLAVSGRDAPWSAPVYFVYRDGNFYFFSNETSNHIRYAHPEKKVAASIFHDSDKIDRIFGFQMSGRIIQISDPVIHLKVVKAYVDKFNFLKKIFGPQIIENRKFFLEKFKSGLYRFAPEKVVISDNSQTSGKRREFDLSVIS